jgi:hypothetical protein
MIKQSGQRLEINAPGVLDHCPVTVDGHEHLISNGGRFKPVFAERDKKQTMNFSKLV